MASITSLMGGSSSTGGIYGNRNVISGLASGMDTEAMIENMVKGNKLKITNLEKQRTQVQWQQEAYRNIINKLANFNLKFNSYTSDKNLSSASFFDHAVDILTRGANADKVSATGKTDSIVSIDSVNNLATSSRYNTAGEFGASDVASEAVDIVGGRKEVGALSGSITLKYGGDADIRLTFSEKDIYQSAGDMAAAINEKLQKETISFHGGNQVQANEKIRARADGGKIVIETVDAHDTNGVHISGADEALKTALGFTADPKADDNLGNSFTVDDQKLLREESVLEKVAENGFTITIDGQTKTIKGPTAAELAAAQGGTNEEKYIAALNAKIGEAFGDGKLRATNASAESGKIQLKFELEGNSKKFKVHSDAGELIGMEDDLTSYVNADRKLGSVVTNFDWDSARLEAKDPNAVRADSGDANHGTDDKGNHYELQNGTWYQVDKNGNQLYDFRINGKTVAAVSKEDTVNDLISKINSNPESDVKAAYSTFNNQFSFTAKETGTGGKVEIADGLAAAMFGASVIDGQAQSGYVQGEDASFNITVNGISQTVTQGSNVVDVDGMKITLQEEFTSGGSVTFTSKTDTDKIMDVIKELVKDYNDMATEIKNAFSTMPLQDSRGRKYMPLSDEERADMSESELKRYEEKAKTGLLFADRDIADLYQGLTEALNVFGTTGNDMQKIGITTTYKDGVTTLAIDEEQLRKSLETDLDKVKDIFTRKMENGAETPGLMESLGKEIDRYASTSGARKGILVNKAGSPLAPTSVMQNDMQEKVEAFDKQIEVMRLKVADQIDFYNRKFSALEQMIAQMNNQSSSLMGMSGGF